MAGLLARALPFVSGLFGGGSDDSGGDSGGGLMDAVSGIGSNLLSRGLSGIGDFATNLISGESFGDAAKSGLQTAFGNEPSDKPPQQPQRPQRPTGPAPTPQQPPVRKSQGFAYQYPPNGPPVNVNDGRGGHQGAVRELVRKEIPKPGEIIVSYLPLNKANQSAISASFPPPTYMPPEAWMNPYSFDSSGRLPDGQQVGSGRSKIPAPGRDPPSYQSLFNNVGDNYSIPITAPPSSMPGGEAPYSSMGRIPFPNEAPQTSGPPQSWGGTPAPPAQPATYGGHGGYSV